jgi:hypothetical protein
MFSHRLTLAAGLGLASGMSLTAATPATAELIAQDNFAQGVDESNMDAGWTAPWKLTDNLQIKTDSKQMVGFGYAMRPMLQAIDFSQDGEYFFRITVTRTGLTTKGNSYAALQLFNKDKEVENRPLRVGIDSGDRYMFGLGRNERLDTKTKADQPYTLVARVVTAADEPDRLEGWAFEGQTAPSAMPGKPQIVSTLDYDDKVNDLRLQTGNGAGFEAMFQDLRIGTTWGDIAGEAPKMPEAQAFKHEFRKLNRLKVADNGTQAIPIQWANVSLIPNAKGQPPRIVVQGVYRWIQPNSVIFEPAGNELVRKATPKPNPDLPLYQAPQEFTELPKAQYQAVARSGGNSGGGGEGWDLFDISNLTRVATIDAAGQIAVLDRPESLVDSAVRDEVMKDIGGEVKHLADADGDGVADLLVGKWIDRGRGYWPREQAVWSLTPLPHVGPHTDLQVTNGFRGYDIDGNWLGGMRTKELVWFKGQRAGDGIKLGEQQPVYFGRDDFTVQWRNPGRKLAPTIITAKTPEGGPEQRYIVLFAGDAEVKALPILDTPDRETLHVGQAADLLHPETPKQDIFLTVVRNTMDMTGDGRDDIIVGTGANGRAIVISGDTVGQYRVVGAIEQVGGPLGADTLTVPARADWDGDGNPDLVTGDGTGYYMLYPGTEDPLVYAGSHTFQRPDGEPVLYKGTKNLQGPHESGWSYSQPMLFDWDGDGELELIGNDNTNTLRLHQRAPAPGSEPWVIGSSDIFTYQNSKLGVGWRSRMAGLPGEYRLAGDDRPVLLFIDLNSELKLGIPESVGSTVIEKMIPLKHTDDSPIVTAGSAGMSGRTQLSVPDWDGDGVWDIMFNVPAKTVEIIEQDPKLRALNEHLKTSTMYWLKNVGTNSEPSFDKPRRITHKDGAIIRTETHSMNIEPTDLNGDGQLDLIFGDGPGFVYYLMRDEIAWD